MRREPLISIQKRLTEAGRIRAGEKTDKGAPKRLDTWRITSPQKHLIEEAVALYGGEIKPWKSPVGDEWEVVTQTASLPVLLMPNYSLKMSYEMWEGPSKCTRRCDGLVEQISGEACLCNRVAADFKGPECDLHTRLTVALPELTTLLGWRVESKGQNAARELAGGMELAEAIALGRAFIPAKLLLTERRGQKDGQAVRYVVPAIDLGISYTQASELAPGYTPVPPREAPALTVGEAVAKTNEQVAPKAQTSRSAAPIGQVVDFTGTQVSAGGVGGTEADRGETASGSSPDGNSGETVPAEDPIINKADRNKLFGTLRGAGMNDDQIRDLVKQVTGEPSTAKMTVRQLDEVLAKATA